MLQHIAAMALGESAIQVQYKGKKGFATIVIDADGGADYSPLVSLGVSDSSVAQAVTNKVTAFTGASTSTLDDLIVAINNCLGGTVDGDDDIKLGDFQARIKDSLRTDSLYSAAAAEFANEAGTAQNLKGYVDSTTGYNWFSTLVRDNDANGVGAIYKRVPPPDISNGPVAIGTITGISSNSGTAITNGLVREILDDKGSVLWTYSDATPTAAEAKFYFENGPIVFDGPVVVRDSVLVATDYAEMDATTTAITWGQPANNR